MFFSVEEIRLYSNTVVKKQMSFFHVDNYVGRYLLLTTNVHQSSKREFLNTDLLKADLDKNGYNNKHIIQRILYLLDICIPTTYVTEVLHVELKV